MKPQIEKKTQLLIEEIKKSNKMSSEEKMDMEGILLSASEGTNGLTPEEKLQNVSETVYSIITLLISKRLDSNSPTKLQGIFNTICECKWQLTICFAVLAILLVFQPQIATIIAGLFA